MARTVPIVFLLSFLMIISPKDLLAKASDTESLDSLIDLGLKNSLDQKAAKLETKYQQETLSLALRNKYIPQISLSMSQLNYRFDSLYESKGQLVNNDGQRPVLGLTISYDLQKLFNSDSNLAKQNIETSQTQERISERDIRRNIKKGFYTILEIQSEIDELSKLNALFSRIDETLKKQKRMGIYVDIEQKQFQLQQSILNSDFQMKKSELEGAYFQLSLLMNVPVETIKDRILKINKTPNLIFAQSRFSPDKLSKLNDQEIKNGLAANYELARAESDSFHSFALPSIYVKQSRETPSMPSSDGYQNITEIGLSFPIDSFFTRSAQKSQLNAKTEKAEAVLQKTLLEYQNQIRLNATNLQLFLSQSSQLETTRKDAKDLLDKSFLYYSQKRIDTLGTLDIFQKYLQATRNVLLNNLQIQNIDTDLEYLVGKGS